MVTWYNGQYYGPTGCEGKIGYEGKTGYEGPTDITGSTGANGSIGIPIRGINLVNSIINFTFLSVIVFGIGFLFGSKK